MKMGIFSAYELAMEGVQARSHFPEFIARFNNLYRKIVGASGPHTYCASGKIPRSTGKSGQNPPEIANPKA